ncbi:hypothetical protein CBOM_06777 [Ceraceosorus bombacis]|uniref:Mitochondrial escape protein 2 n=1 Tax=Ceraceosorus bombacis TaxID=401625 RepID=A0A0P1BRA3_9BASI|nr:hypothetical protein CBOM_06777 [Ceraceosorus bombacis]
MLATPSRLARRNGFSAEVAAMRQGPALNLPLARIGPRGYSIGAALGLSIISAGPLRSVLSTRTATPARGLASSSSPSVGADGTVTLPSALIEQTSSYPLVPLDLKLEPDERLGFLYFDTMFPIELNVTDPRRYLVSVQGEALLQRLQNSLPASEEVGYAFSIVGVESRAKDGGAFLSFKYKASGEDEAKVLNIIETRLKQGVKSVYAPSMLLVASWARPPSVHVVRGQPWREDLARFPARQIRIEFEGGPAPDEQTLWETLRPYGRLLSLKVDKKEGSAIAGFSTMRGATSARNCAHGATLSSGAKLIINYQPAFRAHKAWEWISSHPRIVLPFLALTLGTITYSVFNPVREFFVERELDGSFRLEDYRLYTWLKTNTLELFNRCEGAEGGNAWWERGKSVEEIRGWLRETPSTFITIAGPRGSGKHQLLDGVLTKEVSHLRINCEAIARAAKTDSALIGALANELGYWPVFSWISSVNNLIDIGAQGLIGSKEPIFATPVDAQLRQVLETATAALMHTNSNKQKAKAKEEKRRLAKKVSPDEQSKVQQTASSDGEFDAPVIVLDGFCHKGLKNEMVWDVLAAWSAELTQSHIAHVIFVSDNPVAQGKTLGRALPNVPFQSVVLADADQERAQEYVRKKLEALQLATPSPAPDTPGYSPAVRGAELDQATVRSIDVLGGRMQDLEALTEKLGLGQNVPDAVEDIVTRTVVELRKNAFGDDLEDAKSLPWKRGQAWTIVEQLSKGDELAYYGLLHDAFKGDEAAVKALEQAEIISVKHADGRPSSIRAGRPVLREAMRRLVSEEVFANTQRLLSANEGIESTEKLVRDVEKELTELSALGSAGSGATRRRMEYLLTKLNVHQTKIDTLDALAESLKKQLNQTTG